MKNLLGFLNVRRWTIPMPLVAAEVETYRSDEYLDALHQLLDEVDDALTLALDANERIATHSVCGWEARCHTYAALKLLRAIVDDLVELREGLRQAA